MYMVMLGLLIAAYLLQLVIMLGELKKGLGMKRKCLCSKATTVLLEGTVQKCKMWFCYIFIAPYIKKYNV